VVGLPVTANLQFEPSVTLREEFTDNFNLTERKKLSNFRTAVSPELRLGINFPQTKGLIVYNFSPSYDTRSEDNEVLFFHSLLGQIVWQANPRWQLTLADTFTKSDQRAEADRLGLRQERRTFTTNTLALTSDYLIGTVATRQAYQLTTFSDDDGSETMTHTLAANATVPVYQLNLFSLGYDYLTSEVTGGSSNTGGQFVTAGEDATITGHRFTASASRKISALTTVGLKGSYALRNVSSNDDDDDFQIWNASVFTQYVLPGRLRLDANIGVTGLSSGSESLGPEVFTASSLTYEFARAVAVLAVDRGFSETFAEGQNFGVVETQGVTASLSYPFSPWLTGTVSGFYRRNRSTNAGSASGLDQNEETTNWGGSATVAWRVHRRVLFDLSYSYFEQVGSDNGSSGTASGDARSYTENRVQASIRFNF
jgi:hypothetical protein